MRDRRWLIGTLLFWTVGLAGGCGPSGPTVETVPVAGTVYLDQKPVAGVTVVFIGEGMKFVGRGKTGPDGKYQLDDGTIPGKRGAMPGMNQVYFAEEDETASSEPPMMPVASSATVLPKQGLLPLRYCNPAKPELTFSVPKEGTDVADFRLSSK